MMNPKSKEGTLLIVDDNKSVLNALRLLLRFEFADVRTLSGPKTLLREIEHTDPDVVLLDMNYQAGESTGNEGIYWLREIKRIRPDTEVVMFTAYGDVDLAVKATREGAADFILKPWENEKMIATLRAAYRLRKSAQTVSILRKREQELKDEWNKDDRMIIGISPLMQQVMEVVKKVARTDANVLITGENGTGKELIAKEIHRLSDRSHELLVAVDLGSVSENLFESEMFGHCRGSFTDAYEDRKGKIMLANHGTLLLDEIGNLPLTLQAKLLNVLQNRIVLPVGSDQGHPVDIRLICTTNKDLQNMVSGKEFRQDLLYRINTIRIELPPLRERREDIEILAGFFASKYTRKYKKPDLKIHPLALEQLTNYNWPGNIRELQHTIEKGVILCEHQHITSRDLVLDQAISIPPDEPVTLEEMEKRMIRKELKSHGQNLSVIAKHLGISRPTLYKKMKKYGL
jgi:DNA-binding NtrC family response regulator